MLGSPAPSTSHVSGAAPGLEFSHAIGFLIGASHGPAAWPVPGKRSTAATTRRSSFAARAITMNPFGSKYSFERLLDARSSGGWGGADERRSYVALATDVADRPQQELDVLPQAPVGDVEVVDADHLLHRHPAAEDLPWP